MENKILPFHPPLPIPILLHGQQTDSSVVTTSGLYWKHCSLAVEEKLCSHHTHPLAHTHAHSHSH